MRTARLTSRTDHGHRARLRQRLGIAYPKSRIRGRSADILIVDDPWFDSLGCPTPSLLAAYRESIRQHIEPIYTRMKHGVSSNAKAISADDLRSSVTTAICDVSAYHNAECKDLIYTAGVFVPLELGYNKGPVDWDPSSVDIYPTGQHGVLASEVVA